jgi:hypothetical protein
MYIHHPVPDEGSFQMEPFCHKAWSLWPLLRW